MCPPLCEMLCPPSPDPSFLLSPFISLSCLLLALHLGCCVSFQGVLLSSRFFLSPFIFFLVSLHMGRCVHFSCNPYFLSVSHCLPSYFLHASCCLPSYGILCLPSRVPSTRFLVCRFSIFSTPMQFTRVFTPERSSVVPKFYLHFRDSKILEKRFYLFRGDCTSWQVSVPKIMPNLWMEARPGFGASVHACFFLFFCLSSHGLLPIACVGAKSLYNCSDIWS